LRNRAVDLARLYATRIAPAKAQQQYQEAVQAAAQAARRAGRDVAAARAAVPRPDVDQLRQQLETERLAWLAEDLRLTMEGARGRFGGSWIQAMSRETTPQAQQAVYQDRLNRVNRAWEISRREEIDFLTSGAPGVSALANFRPPAAEAQRQVTPLIPGSDHDPIAPEVIRFVQELRRRDRDFSVWTYAGHGGGPFHNRGYSIDIGLGSRRDNRGFYPPNDAVAFLRQVHEAARAAGVEWRAIYNDFSVADAINRETGARRVIFVGKPRTQRRRDGTTYSNNLNWHGPDPLIIHFHIDLVPR